MFLCNSWYLKRQHKKKQNDNSSNPKQPTSPLTAGKGPNRWRIQQTRKNSSAFNKAVMQIQQSQMDVEQSESAWKSLLTKGLPDSPSTSTILSYCSSECIETNRGEDRQLGVSNEEAEVPRKLADEHRLIKTSPHQLPPRDFLLIKELRSRRRLSDLTSDREHLPNWKSTRQEELESSKITRRLTSSSPSLFLSITDNEPSESVSNPMNTIGKNDSIEEHHETDATISGDHPESTTAPTNTVDRLVMPPWFQDFREQAHLRARRNKKEPTHNWASAQMHQMQYDIRQEIGKRLHVDFDCDFDQ